MCCAYHQCATKTERNELGNAQGRPFKPVFQCLPSFNVFGRVDPAPSKCFGAANGAFPIPTAKNRRLRVRIYIVVRLSPSTCIHRTVFVVTSIHLSHPLGREPGCSSSNRQGDTSLCTRTRNTNKKESSILLEHRLVVRPQKITNPQRAWVHGDPSPWRSEEQRSKPRSHGWNKCIGVTIKTFSRKYVL